MTSVNTEHGKTRKTPTGEIVLSCFFVKNHLSAVIFAILIILVEKKQ
jgi:hypothetical protein